MEDSTKLDYTRTTLFRTNEFEIISCDWKKGSTSPMHSHGWSQCRFQIVEGQFENTCFAGFTSETKIYIAGDVVTSLVGAKHSFKCLSETGKTFHVYTPHLAVEKSPELFTPVTSAEVRRNLDLALKPEGISLSELSDLAQKVQAGSLPANSPYFMNQLFSGVTPEMLLAEEIIAKSRTTAATFEASPIFSTIEQEVIFKLGELIGWSENLIDGVSVPGGSAANFMALHCARQKYDPEIKKIGFKNQPQFKIFVSGEAHYSFKKATVALGFGTDSLVAIATDSKGKMRMDLLENSIQECLQRAEVPLLACATAGTTVLGTFDPIDEMAAICKKYKMWLHVDGAWGGPILFSEKKKTLLKGIAKADSMAFDAHKLLGANLTCSFFLTQHKGLLFEANDVTGADYLFHENDENCDLGRQSWQCGRRPDAFSLWMIWKSAGTNGIAKFLDRLYAVQAETVAWIKSQDRLELIAEPEYFNICVRIKPPDLFSDQKTWSQQVRNILRQKNQALVNYSTDANGTFLRLILAHPDISFQNTKQILEWALEARSETEKKFGDSPTSRAEHELDLS